MAAALHTHDGRVRIRDLTTSSNKVYMYMYMVFGVVIICGIIMVKLRMLFLKGKHQHVSQIYISYWMGSRPISLDIG